MLKDPKKVAKIWSEELAKASTEIVSHALRGEELETTTVDVSIVIPTSLVQAILVACEKTGADPEDVISQMASEGLETSIKERISVGKKTDVKIPSNTEDALSQLKGLGLDMSGLEGKMGDLNDLMKKITQMKDLFDGTDTSGKTDKNP